MNLFRRQQPLRSDVVAAMERLGRLAETSPELGGAVQLQRAILLASYRDPRNAAALELAPDRAAAKLRAGIPLLRDEAAPLDPADLQAAALRLCRAIREQGEAREAADAIAAAIRARALDVPALAEMILGGQAGAMREQAETLRLDAGLLGTLLRFSLLPALEGLAAQLAPLRESAAWGRGFCPTCGSWPLLGEYRGLEQTRVLRCGLCTTGWAIDRLLCPFCGSRDHEDLGYLYAEGEQQKRAATCESCRGYVKMLATLAAIPPAELPVEDLATIHLDMIALERGYSPPE
jgi:FdhE protein